MTTIPTLDTPASPGHTAGETAKVSPTTPPAHHGTLRVTRRRAYRSERMRLTGLRSTWAVAATTLVAMIGTAAAVSSTIPPDALGDARQAFPLLLSGSTLAVLIVSAFGAVVGARDHVTGAIRTTFTLVPRRRTVVAAKVAALLSVLVPTLLVAHVGAVVAGSAILSASHMPMPAPDAEAVLALAGSTLSMTSVGLLGLALGLVLRSIGGSVAAALGGYVALPGLVGLLWSTGATWLPSQLGSVLSAIGPAVEGMPSRLAAGLALVGWVLGALAAAAAVLDHRDA